MTIQSTNYVCKVCNKAEIILQPVSFIKDGYLMRTSVLVCSNRQCVEKRGGIVVKHREEQSLHNMAKNASGMVIA